MIAQSRDKILSSSENCRSTRRKEHLQASQLKSFLKVKKISSRKNKKNSFPRKIKKQQANQKNLRILLLLQQHCMLQPQTLIINLILSSPNTHQNNLQLIFFHLIILPQQWRIIFLLLPPRYHLHILHPLIFLLTKG